MQISRKDENQIKLINVKDEYDSCFKLRSKFPQKKVEHLDFNIEPSHFMKGFHLFFRINDGAIQLLLLEENAKLSETIQEYDQAMRELVNQIAFLRRD